MANDVNIDSSGLLREYSGKLKGFSSSIHRGSRNLMNALEQEEHDLNRTIRDLERLESNLISRAEDVIRRYDDAKSRYRLDGINSAMLGTTDFELKQKLAQLKASISTQKEMVRKCVFRLQSIRERAKSFSANISGLAERGTESLDRYADIIDDYKQTRQ